MKKYSHNVADWVRYWGRVRPDKPAIIFKGEEITYYQLSAQTSKLARWLEKEGLSRGDRLAVLMTNSPFFLMLFLACAGLGIIFVPLNFRLSPRELKYLIENADPGILFFSPEFAEKVVALQAVFPGLKIYTSSQSPKETLFTSLNLADLPEGSWEGKEIDPESPQVIMFTSGTTGFPKGAVLSYRKTFFNVLNASFFFEATTGDTMLLVLPLFHSGGLFIMAAPMLYSGGSIVLEPKFRNEKSIEQISMYGVTKILAVPTIYRRILQDINRYYDHLKLLKTRLIGGEKTNHELISAFHDMGLPLRQVFGQTETSILLWGDEHLTYHFRDSVGYPVFHSEVKLIDGEGRPVSSGKIGEIIARGQTLMNGYWGDPKQTEKTLRGGWLYTGDLGRQDDDGRFYIAGRKKEVYISGGENIYAAEVERIINSHPSVFEAAVIGVPDKHWGEVGMAFIVKKEAHQLTEEGLIDFCSDKLGSYKIPRHFSFIPELPKTSLGKTRKYQLKEQFLKTGQNEQA